MRWPCRLALLHPTPPGDGAVEPGSTFDVGVDQSSEMKVFVPKDFPGDEGLDSIKLIAATRRVDLVALANRADQGDRAEATDVPLERLLMLASWRAAGRDREDRLGSGVDDPRTVVPRSARRIGARPNHAREQGSGEVSCQEECGRRSMIHRASFPGK